MLENLNISKRYKQDIIRVIKTIISKNRDVRRIVIEGAEPYIFNISKSITTLIEEIKQSDNIEIIVNSNPRFGACDIDLYYYKYIKPDVVLHLGHNPFPNTYNKLRRSGIKFYFIPFLDDIELAPEFMQTIENKIKDLNPDIIFILYSVQYRRAADSIYKMLKNRKIKVVVPKIPGLIRGQILGCLNQYLKPSQLENPLYVVISSGIFHALGVALYSGTRTILVDPFNSRILDMTRLVNKYRSLIAWNLYKARSYSKYAIIVVKDSHQPFIGGLPHMINILKRHNLTYSIYHIDRVTEDVMKIIPKDELPIIAGCPRIAIDDITRFNRPIINFEQLQILLNIKEFNEVYPPIKNM